MKSRLNNIIGFSVTLFLFSCGVNGKLDQNLAEMHNMNKNMEAMNQNMANGISQFNDVGKSVKTLSDETVAFLKKTDPQQFFDMFDKISNKFEEMMAGMFDKTGDLKTFIQQANAATKMFLDYSKQLTPEDLGNVKESLDKISGMTTQVNELLAKSGNYEAMANQVLITTQIFTAVGLSLGQSLDVISPNDTKNMLAVMDTQMKNSEMMGSAKDLSEKMMAITRKVATKNNTNKLTKTIDGMLKTVIPAIDKLSHIWKNDKMSLDQKWDQFSSDYAPIFCFVASTMAEAVQMDPPGPNPISDDQVKRILKQYELLKPICDKLQKTTPKNP